MHRPHTAYKGDIASYYWCDTVSTILLILAITIVSLVRIPYAIPFSCLPILTVHCCKAVQKRWLSLGFTANLGEGSLEFHCFLVLPPSALNSSSSQTPS